MSANVIVKAMVPGETGRKLFGLEVVGVSRFHPIEGGYQRLHHEAGSWSRVGPWLPRCTFAGCLTRFPDARLDDGRKVGYSRRIERRCARTIYVTEDQASPHRGE